MKKRTFQPGLIYVFSNKKFKQRRDPFVHVPTTKLPKLGKRYNGRLVTLVDSMRYTALIESDNCYVNIAWCKCIGREGEIARIKKHRKISYSKRKRKAGL